MYKDIYIHSHIHISRGEAANYAEELNTEKHNEVGTNAPCDTAMPIEDC